MNEDTNTKDLEIPPMHSRTITLADGRYMVFYTFGSEPPPSSAAPADDTEL